MLLLFEVVFLLLAFLDLEFTKRKIAESGIEVELNPLIRWLVRKTNLAWGAWLGVMLPTFGWMAAGYKVPMLLAFVLGVRSLLFVLQVRSQWD
jgi:hypothetical protein